MNKGEQIRVQLQHELIEILNKLETEETTDQEEVFPCTVGNSTTPSWWRFKNKYEIKQELIEKINELLK